ncbi:hypothetical protein [Lentilactobacillus buchneri]|uniref:hypothetical protein n=1 Tax=Lentilactobacillus buchneri TaxID=1581 RepID=UPI0011EFECE2|nr:hypothetical protein [Lentilactobacillus buchneri]
MPIVVLKDFYQPNDLTEIVTAAIHADNADCHTIIEPNIIVSSSNVVSNPRRYEDLLYFTVRPFNQKLKGIYSFYKERGNVFLEKLPDNSVMGLSPIYLGEGKGGTVPKQLMVALEKMIESFCYENGVANVDRYPFDRLKSAEVTLRIVPEDTYQVPGFTFDIQALPEVEVE